MEYYILSLKWTHPKDQFFTFWRPLGKGFTFLKKFYGCYNSESTNESTQHIINANDSEYLKIECSKVDALCVSVMYEGHISKALPIRGVTLEMLGIRRAWLQQEHPTDFSGVELLHATTSKP